MAYLVATRVGCGWELRVLYSDWSYNLEMGGTLTLVFVLENQGGQNHSR
jgi:hypothetical protein